MAAKKLLVATDLPFWRNSTGAEARIHSLCRYLAERVEVEVFFPGTAQSIAAAEIPPMDRIRITPVTSDQPPERISSRLKWYAEATFNQAGEWLTSATSHQTGLPRSMLKLADFRWPWAIRRFSETFQRMRPDFVLVEYVKLGYLLEGIPPRDRDSVCCWIDTHDVLSVRARQFEQHGYPHWISISEDEETEALRKFDVILAIQPEEANWFRKRIPDSEIKVVGHSFAGRPLRLANHNPVTNELVIGYLGSNNPSNVDAIRKFIQQAWPGVIGQSPTRCRLKVCGTVCRSLHETQESLPESIELLEDFGELQSFYDAVHVVINPVEFGTGLKIKNCEALYCGMPLITTRSGFVGIAAELADAVLIVDEVPAMADAIVSLSRNPAELDRLREVAASSAQSVFSDQQAYSELRVLLERRM